MYLIRRIYKTKPGESRRVATLVHKQLEIYHDAGQRGEFRVSFNGATMPGEQDVVVMEWQDETIQSPYRGGNEIPKEVLDLQGKIRPLIESQRIEFQELLTPDKFQD